jgi:hypothetical protein
MPHWDHRPEPRWKDFRFNQAYAKGLARLKEDVLGKTDFDPAAFDCRVQRYLVRGMIEAAQEFTGRFGFEVRFDTTIPSGAPTCHFTMWKATDEEREAWGKLTGLLEAKALDRSKRRTQ